MSGIRFYLEVVDFSEPEFDMIFWVSLHIGFLQRNFAIIYDNQQPVSIGSGKNKIPVGAVKLNDFRMLRRRRGESSCSKAAGFDDTFDHLGVGYFEKYFALPDLSQFDGGVLEFDPEPGVFSIG